LTIAASQGLAAEFSPGVQVVPVSGTASFLLMVHNTGNIEDTYTTTIVGTSGPVAAHLVGLDGQPTQAIAGFALPGLATGAILLESDIGAAGQGTVTVKVQSQSDTARAVTTMASIATPAPTPTPTPTPTATPAPIPTPAPAPSATSPVTVTGLTVTKVKLSKKPHAPRALVLDVKFSGALDAHAAQNLGAYVAFSGKIKKVHKVKQVIYNKLVPLTQAIYFPAASSVVLLPRGKPKLPKLEQLQVNVQVLTDPMGRPINNGKNFDATVTNTGFIVTTIGASLASAAPAAPALDALFEQSSALPARGIREFP
jgi:hypothetical protein